MISLLILFFAMRKIGQLAAERDLPVLRWKLVTLIAWILGDLTGELLIIHFFGFNLALLALFGPGLAYVGYLIVRQYLENKDPKDLEEDNS